MRGASKISRSAEKRIAQAADDGSEAATYGRSHLQPDKEELE
jgi:hypothetical protein